MSESTLRLAGADWLHARPLAQLLDLLNRDGEEARVVGGAVRNALLGEPPGDVDISTTALPQEVTRRLEAAGLKAVPTGIDHGTVTAVIEGRPFEVTTLRQDVETFGRKARVQFGRDWRMDAERRDFTMNALSLAPDGIVHDYVGGLGDVAARHVRFIGDPAVRIAEDYLRILRFFRFHAAYGEGELDPAGLHACIAARGGLEALSRERVRTELLKLLVARHAVATLVAMTEAGLLIPVLGGVPRLASFAVMTKLEAARALSPEPIRRLGALAAFIAEDAERLWQRLRLANAEHERLAFMADGWWRVTPALSEAERRALLYRLGPARFLDRVLLAWSRAQDADVGDPKWAALAGFPTRWQAPAFPLRASALIGRGIAKGPRLGAALRAAEEAWIAADFPDDEASLAAIADAAAARGKAAK